MSGHSGSTGVRIPGGLFSDRVVGLTQREEGIPIVGQRTSGGRGRPRGHRTVAATVAGLIAAGAFPAGATAAEAPSPLTQTTYGTSAIRCQVEDSRLNQLSGMVVVGPDVYVLNDTAPLALWRLDASCAVAEQVKLTTPPPNDPRLVKPSDPPSDGTTGNTPEGKRYDLEDLAEAPDGALWIGDLGGNTASRTVASLYRWVPGTSTRAVERYDLRYPDGPHDAEALLISLTGQVVIVTKVASGKAGVYAASLPLSPVTTLERVAELDIRALRAKSDTAFAGLQVTGGAVAPDRVHFVLRTYTAGYEWDAADGDVLRALREGRPRVVPLSNAPRGEAIAYAEDGSSFLTLTEQVPAPLGVVQIQRKTLVNAGSRTPALSRPVLSGLVALTALLVGIGLLSWRRRKARSRLTTYQSGSSGHQPE